MWKFLLGPILLAAVCISGSIYGADAQQLVHKPSSIVRAAVSQAIANAGDRTVQLEGGRPLDIEIPAWTRDPQGFYLGGNEMALSPLAMLAFGEIYRRSGATPDGATVLSRGWVEASFVPRTRSPFSGLDYGYGWFLGQKRAMLDSGDFGGAVTFSVDLMAKDLRLAVEAAHGALPVTAASASAAASAADWLKESSSATPTCMNEKPASSSSPANSATDRSNSWSRARATCSAA